MIFHKEEIDMFKNKEAAKTFLKNKYSSEFASEILDIIFPSISFVPTTQAKTLGMTKFGGTPDLPADLEWSRLTIPRNIEEIAQRGNKEAAQAMREHMQKGLPYTFMGQINLEEVAVLHNFSNLPTHGRLLFFYDLAVGPWDIGERVARVIWDQSPVELLRSNDMPPDLKQAFDKEKAEFEEMIPGFDVKATNYGSMEQFLKPVLTWRFPYLGCPDMCQQFTHLEKCFADFSNLYGNVFNKLEDDFWETPQHINQFYGIPFPVQDDPRFGAVVATNYEKQHLSQEDWKKYRDKIITEAKNWILLLQIALSDWMQDDVSEGVVYFVIHKNDLAKRDFSKVIATYQQT